MLLGVNDYTVHNVLCVHVRCVLGAVVCSVLMVMCKCVGGVQKVSCPFVVSRFFSVEDFRSCATDSGSYR